MTIEKTGGKMPYKTDIAAFVADWWGFAAFLIGVAIAFITGRERQRYKVDTVGRDVKRLSAEVESQSGRIAELERQGNSEAVRLAEISTSQKYIITSLDEIKGSLRGKVDR